MQEDNISTEHDRAPDLVNIRKHAGKPGFLTIRRVLALVGLVVSFGFVGVQINQVVSVASFAIGLLQDTRGKTLQETLAQRIRGGYEPEFFVVVNEWARFSGLVNAVKSGDVAATASQLERTYESQRIRRGDLIIREIAVFTPEFSPIASSGNGTGESILARPDVLEILKARDKKARKKPIGFTWQNADGVPLHSIILPVGGFRVFGYVEAVTVPLVYLDGVANAVNADVRVKNKAGEVIHTFLVAPPAEGEAAGLDPAATLRSFDLSVSDGLGGEWMQLEMTWDATRFDDAIRIEARNNLVLTVVLVLLAWAMGYGLLHFAVFRMIRGFGSAMARLAGGDADVVVPRSGRDEFLDMSGALAVLKANVREVFELKNMVEASTNPTVLVDREGHLMFNNAASRKFLEQWQIKGKSEADVLDLGPEFEAECLDPARLPINRRDMDVKGRNLVISVEGVQDSSGTYSSFMLTWFDATDQRRNQRFAAQVMDDVRQVAQTVGSQSKELQRLAEDLHSQSAATIDRTGEASNFVSGNRDNAEGVASATQDLSTGMQDINTSSSAALQNAKLVMEQLDSADALADELNEQASEIVGVVDMINQIADQTRMLALNANIEAQRAGEAGLGFAVVAAEVKELASETAEATDQISTSVQGIQGSLTATLESFASIRDAMNQVSDVQNSIAGEVDSQTETSGDIAARVERIADGTRNVQEIIDRVSEQARSSGDIAGQLKETSDNLLQQSGQLNKRLDEYQG